MKLVLRLVETGIDGSSRSVDGEHQKPWGSSGCGSE
jgi:hypothetical protein